LPVLAFYDLDRRGNEEHAQENSGHVVLPARMTFLSNAAGRLGYR
jgi:hypothetical protein